MTMPYTFHLSSVSASFSPLMSHMSKKTLNHNTIYIQTEKLFLFSRPSSHKLLCSQREMCKYGQDPPRCLETKREVEDKVVPFHNQPDDKKLYKLSPVDIVCNEGL